MPTVSQGLYKWLISRGATLEDFADRLNHFWTFGLLLLFACIVSWKQGYSRPIQCLVPSEFTEAMRLYTEEKCWNSYFIQYPRNVEKAEIAILEMLNISVSASKYFLRDTGSTPFVNSIEIDEDDDLFVKMSTTRTLYQWLPIILCFQALLFKLPNIFMYILHGYSGVSFDKIAGLTTGYQVMNIQERGHLGKQIASYLMYWCRQFKNFLPWRFLTLTWFAVKVLYCVNIITQMCLIDTFLRTTDPPIDNATSYGDLISGNLLKNNATIWKESPAFPRNIFCNIQIHFLTNISKYLIQCTLPANFFNEYMYMFLWVWLLFVAIVTCFSLMVWTMTTLIPIFRKGYIKKAMAFSDDNALTAVNPSELDKFCNLIGEDGVMALKLIGANSSELLVGSVVCNMWHLQASNYSEPRAGQVMAVPEVQVQPGAPIPQGTSDGAKKME